MQVRFFNGVGACEMIRDTDKFKQILVVVSFAGILGFRTKDGHRVHPFPVQPKWVPLYRDRFSADRGDLPSWIIKKQEVKHCYRMQFPLDLCRAMTCH